MGKKKIVIFASGNGSNAQRIIDHFRNNDSAAITMILTNNPDAFVIQRAEAEGIPCIIFSRSDLNENGRILSLLTEVDPRLIVLAGFLWLIPAEIVKMFSGRMINIHPALLPHYGGPGMYGMKVHKAVIESGEKESGISIHFVNEKYDDGDIIFQAKCKIDEHETPETLAAKIHQLEYRYLPEIIEQII